MNNSKLKVFSNLYTTYFIYGIVFLAFATFWVNMMLMLSATVHSLILLKGYYLLSYFRIICIFSFPGEYNVNKENKQCFKTKIMYVLLLKISTYNTTFNLEQSCSYHSNQNQHIHCHVHDNFDQLHNMSEVKYFREFYTFIINKPILKTHLMYAYIHCYSFGH